MPPPPFHEPQRSFNAHTNWLSLTLEVLRKQIPAAEIVSIDSGEDSLSCDPFYATQVDIDLLTRALNESPWIPDYAKHDGRSYFITEEPDIILAILLPLLPELRCLGLQVDSKLLQATVAQIACAYAAQTEPKDLPLSKLILVHSHGYDGGQGAGLGLSAIAPFLALPSVRRFIVRSARDSSFTQWPANLPRPLTPEVYFSASSVTKAAASGFIKAWQVPCVIRQSWSRGGGEWEVALDWDHAVVTGAIDEVTGKIEEETRIETVEKKFMVLEDMSVLIHAGVGFDESFSDEMNALHDCRVFDWTVLEQEERKTLEEEDNDWVIFNRKT